MKKIALATTILSAMTAFTPLSYAADKDAEFFQNIKGEWTGPGEVVAGKYKGTKFVCTLAGTTPEAKIGMTLDGSCRVGVFSQAMKATVLRSGKSYNGAFNDGAAGKGLDIVSGSVNSDRVVLGLNRKELDGAMLARISDPNTMNVTVSVRVDKELIPVIGMSLKRVDQVAVGSIKKRK